jgi:tRNA nucleotidyltransferase (CCA-adding enzyme)
VKIYVVGGAIRDQLLGLPVKDLDYVVVGATPDQMLAQGYTPVGQDFPVFLHPVTHAEYALARTERKVAPGYKGFVFHADPGVTLEQDLARRDLTINAMAREADANGQPVGDVIDPYGGQQDISNKLFRHIGPAFSEDPVRLLRIARFAARFSDFSIEPTTLTLLKKIHSSGELNALIKERVWQEISRGLMSEKPSRMLEVLNEIDVFELFFPKLNSKDTSLLNNIDLAAMYQFNLSERCAVLCSSLSVKDIHAWSALWGIPVECRDHAVLVRELKVGLNSPTLDPKNLLDLLNRIDVWRKPERFDELIKVAIFLKLPTEQLTNSYDLAKKVDIAQIVQDIGEQGSSTGAKIKQLIENRRLLAIKEVK